MRRPTTRDLLPCRPFLFSLAPPTSRSGRATISRQHINAYRKTLAEQHRITGSLNERVLRKAFAELLERTGRAHDLIFTNEWEGRGPRGNNISVDGALVPPILRKPFGYWEAKDSKDDLDREIASKLQSGYPDDNIIYEDTRTAILRQDGREVMRAALDDDAALLKLLDAFYAHEPAELSEFKAASAKFRADLPQVIEALRMAIGEAEARSIDFATARREFLAHAKQAINPAVTEDDVREMLIQHILTEEIFASVFDNAQYHRENNVARRLGELEAKFFTGSLRHATTELLRPYYGAIKHAASALADRREKQTFLKALYEDFYKVYNPAAADRLGVVYTPGEIVRFMVRGAEWLTERHFGKTLADEGVEILDPATGTGTFVVELIEHMEGAGPDRLRAKYDQELHANEVAILPYYVANLNIEATYAAISGGYAEFPGLVFVDTLDNTAGLGIFKGFQGDMFGGIADENLERVKRQNERKISVIIGNPPYNANQQSENDNNKNRKYPRIDKRIKGTYIAASRATKTKLYDPYARFFRWASDRIRDEGIVAFVTNRSFIDAKTFDGFRKTIVGEFSEGWVIDLGGDYKRKDVGGGGNVFGIGTGVAISFWVRVKDGGRTAVRYIAAPAGSGREKLAWLDTLDMSATQGEMLPNREDGSWIGISKTSMEGMLPLVDARTKSVSASGQDRTIFKLYSLGVSTNRDSWVYDRDRATLARKIEELVQSYDAVPSHTTEWPDIIKWSRNLKRRLAQARREPVNKTLIVQANYRPFQKRWLYRSPLFIDELGLAETFFPLSASNPTICFSDTASRSGYMVLAVDQMADLHFGAALDGYQQVACYRYLKSGERIDNITDWALQRFRAHYADPAISKDAIFAYCYAVLHDPVFREVHGPDLRREFPRIPLYPDFATWVGWGEQLLALHIDYEKVKPFKLKRIDTPDPRGRAPAPKLRSQPDAGIVVVDSDTQLTGIPPAAWNYRLGNRSAIDWVLDQHKEKTPRDPTVRAKFNTYRFADHKEAMITLLAKVVHVSLETVAITDAMRSLDRGGWRDSD